MLTNTFEHEIKDIEIIITHDYLRCSIIAYYAKYIGISHNNLVHVAVVDSRYLFLIIEKVQKAIGTFFLLKL